MYAGESEDPLIFASHSFCTRRIGVARNEMVTVHVSYFGHSSHHVTSRRTGLRVFSLPRERG
jgi:hypothetical protein